eukprot:11894631-Ditylum_brightwellii.AAC.1
MEGGGGGGGGRMAFSSLSPLILPNQLLAPPADGGGGGDEDAVQAVMRHELNSNASIAFIFINSFIVLASYRLSIYNPSL